MERGQIPIGSCAADVLPPRTKKWFSRFSREEQTPAAAKAGSLQTRPFPARLANLHIFFLRFVYMSHSILRGGLSLRADYGCARVAYQPSFSTG